MSRSINSPITQSSVTDFVESPIDDISTRTYLRRFRSLYFLERFSRNPLAVAGVIIFMLILLMAIFADHIAPTLNRQILFLPFADDGSPRLSPFPDRLFGYTGIFALRQSVFSLVVYGSRATLFIALTSAITTTIIGVVLGGISGYFGGIIDNIIMRTTDILLAFPLLPLIIALRIASQREPTVTFFIVTFTVVGWTPMARIVRATFLSLREQEYIEAAKATGIPWWRIIFRHLLPNTLSPIIVTMTLSIATFIIAESTLDFLQLGITSAPTWGNTLAFSTEALLTGLWWWVFFPGLFIGLTTFSLTQIGEGLREALDIRGHV